MEKVSLHTFTDASKLAYAAVSNARYKYVSGKISVALVTAKARVAPIKSVGIPRLELMGAVLGVRLAETVSEKLKKTLSEHTLWMDSMGVICCVQGHSRRLKSLTFVANRVAEIQRKISPAQWRDVPGEENPADTATRGLALRDMSTESRWFQGPSFLHEGEESWPLDHRPYETDCTEEGKQELSKISLTFQTNRSFPLLDADRFPSWLKLVRVTAWIMRFISPCKRARLHGI